MTLGSLGPASCSQLLLANISVSSLMPPPAFATVGLSPCSVHKLLKRPLLQIPGSVQDMELTSAVPGDFVTMAPHLRCEQCLLAPRKRVSAALQMWGALIS